MEIPRCAFLIPIFLPLFLLPAGAQDAPIDRLRRSEIAQWREQVSASTTFVSDTTVDVRFYHLTLDVSVARPYIAGRVNVRFTSNVDSLRQLRLDLHWGFVVDSVSQGTAIVRGGDSLVIQLAAPIARGEDGVVSVYYHGVPPVIGGRKGLRYSTHGNGERVIASLSTPFLAHSWWPCKDGPGDKADSVWLDVTIPDTSIAGLPVIAASNGILERTSHDSGRSTFYWRHRYPIVPFYVMLAISNYTAVESGYIRDRVSFPITYYVFADHRDSALAGTAAVPQVIDLFSALFGDYPFWKERFAMTQLDGTFRGAIENQTNVVTDSMSTSWFRVTIHELAHSWFGNMITCRDWRHAWLNEGFASYCEALWAEHYGGATEYADYMRMFEWGALGEGPVLIPPTSDPTQVFMPVVYSKGAWVLHMLRGIVGDNTFAAIMREYSADTTLRYGLALSSDFQRIAERVSEMDLDFFFEEWLSGHGEPRYAFAATTGSATTLISIEQLQVAFGYREVFAMPLRVRLVLEGGGDTTVVLWNDQRRQTWTVTMPRAIVGAQLDPDRWVLRVVQGPTGVDGADAALGSFTIAVRPMPVDARASIAFSLPRSGRIDLGVFDARGEEVERLIDGEAYTPGHHLIEWAPRAELPRGAYFVRLSQHGRVVAESIYLID